MRAVRLVHDGEVCGCGSGALAAGRRGDEPSASSPRFSLVVPLFFAYVSTVLLPLCYYILPLLLVSSLWRHRQQGRLRSAGRCLPCRLALQSPRDLASVHGVALRRFTDTKKSLLRNSRNEKFCSRRTRHADVSAPRPNDAVRPRGGLQVGAGPPCSLAPVSLNR